MSRTVLNTTRRYTVASQWRPTLPVTRLDRKSKRSGQREHLFAIMAVRVLLATFITSERERQGSLITKYASESGVARIKY